VAKAQRIMGIGKVEETVAVKLLAPRVNAPAAIQARPRAAVANASAAGVDLLAEETLAVREDNG
jgi:hypothetical protein